MPRGGWLRGIRFLITPALSAGLQHRGVPKRSKGADS